jgi:hypothetical protein
MNKTKKNKEFCFDVRRGLCYPFYKALRMAGTPKNPTSIGTGGSFPDLKWPGFAALQN